MSSWARAGRSDLVIRPFASWDEGVNSPMYRGERCQGREFVG